MGCLKKEVCQRCYQYHERIWGEGNDAEWERGEVHCPMEHFEMLRMRGKDLAIKDKRLRDIFGMIFGWLSTDEANPPPWCEFAEHHKLTKKTN
jgi:hypothetical protein